MGIKLDEKTKTFTVCYAKRHPVTRRPYSARRIGVKTRAMAQRVFTELVVQVEKKLHQSVTPSWENLVCEYIKDLSLRNVSAKTVETYFLCLKAHTFKEWANRLIDEISTAEIREVISIKLADRSPSHQKNVLKYIRGAFTFAVEKDYLDRNPVPIMKFRIGDKLKTVLTLEQVKILLTQAKLMESEWYPVWATALYTGMRNGELYALTWDKVNFEQRRILVDSSWNNEDGFKDTKSGDDRMVEIAPELLIILKELKLESFESSFVLPRIDKWDRGEQARELRLFLMGLGLPRIRFHDLRATWATIMLSLGIPPIKVMFAGGWKDLKTMQFYIRKAGVDTSGISDNLSLHNPLKESNVLSMM
jgi:integrase